MDGFIDFKNVRFGRYFNLRCDDIYQNYFIEVDISKLTYLSIILLLKKVERSYTAPSTCRIKKKMGISL
jgi:hypothetical protein